MSKDTHWVLPQGIEEALPEQAERLEALRRELLDIYSSWGYELVMPPFIDHIESLITGTGHDLDLQTFKLVDQVSGRTLGIRADMTPQVARIDAAQLNRNVATRLCYFGTVLRTRPDCFGGSRSPLQVGAELFGHAGIESEVEIIGLMLKTFETAGVEDVYIDLGNVDIFRNLARQAGLSVDDEGLLFELLQRKAVTEISQLLEQIQIEEKYKTMLASLAELNGGVEVLARAKDVLSAAGESVNDALDYLQNTSDLINKRFNDVSLNIDLAELHGYHYKTGVVFAAFVPQSGQAIARGGRYDDIGQLFGRARAATGFSTDLKKLTSVSKRQFDKIESVFAPNADDSALQEKIETLRNDGVRVIQQLSSQGEDAKSLGCKQMLEQKEGSWILVDVI